MDTERPAQKETDPDRESAGQGEESVVGPLLRAARLQSGLELADVSATLRIRLIHLEAIEDGRFDDLPGPTYAVGFVRAYADFLGLDRNQVVERFRQEVSGLDKKTELNFPAPLPESRVPSGAVLLISVLLAAGAYGGWYYLTMGNRSDVELVSQVPQQLAGLLEKPAVEETAPPPWEAASKEPPRARTPALPEPSVPPAQSSDGAPSPSAVGAAPAPGPARAGALAESGAGSASPADGTSGGSANEVTPSPETMDEDEADAAGPAGLAESGDARTDGEPATQFTDTEDGGAGVDGGVETVADGGMTDDVTAPAELAAVRSDVPRLPEPSEAAAATPPQVFGAGNTDARIVIRAKSDSWVQVRDREGDLVLTRMLRYGDTYRVPDREGLTLLTGNAGALEIYVDGELAPSLGPGGAVRRDVILDAERLLAGTATQN